MQEIKEFKCFLVEGKNIFIIKDKETNKNILIEDTDKLTDLVLMISFWKKTWKDNKVKYTKKYGDPFEFYNRSSEKQFIFIKGTVVDENEDEIFLKNNLFLSFNMGNVKLEDFLDKNSIKLISNVNFNI